MALELAIKVPGECAVGRLPLSLMDIRIWCKGLQEETPTGEWPDSFIG